MSHSFFKSIGAIFLVSGTCIGAGMLALPLVTAECGFLWSMLLFAICFVVMLYSSFLVLEVNSAMPEHSSFSTMADRTLGRFGRYLTWIMFLLLLYALLAAYNSAGGELVAVIFKQLGMSLSLKWAAFGFTLVFGLLVFGGVSITETANRGLFFIKLLFFVLAVLWMSPHVNWSHLSSLPRPKTHLWAPILVVLTAFGSHFIIPTIRAYIGPDSKRLKWIIFIGMSIPLVVYILWQVVVFGMLSFHGPMGLFAVSQSDNKVANLVLALVSHLQGSWVKTMLNGFMDIAVTTSFLGIALSLFDFLLDGLKLNKQCYVHRALVAALTFVVPLLFAVFYPAGFIGALRYAAIFAAVLVLILPAAMSWALPRKGLEPFARLSGGLWARGLTLLAGVVVIALFWLT